MSLLECTLPSAGYGSPIFEKAKKHQQADALPKPHSKVFFFGVQKFTFAVFRFLKRQKASTS
jgi:hypothetical protein